MWNICLGNSTVIDTSSNPSAQDQQQSQIYSGILYVACEGIINKRALIILETKHGWLIPPVCPLTSFPLAHSSFPFYNIIAPPHFASFIECQLSKKISWVQRLIKKTCWFPSVKKTANCQIFLPLCCTKRMLMYFLFIYFSLRGYLLEKM